MVSLVMASPVPVSLSLHPVPTFLPLLPARVWQCASEMFARVRAPNRAASVRAML